MTSFECCSTALFLDFAAVCVQVNAFERSFSSFLCLSLLVYVCGLCCMLKYLHTHAPHTHTTHTCNAHTCKYTHTHTHMQIHTHSHTCMHAHIHTHTEKYTRTQTHTHTYRRGGVRMREWGQKALKHVTVSLWVHKHM